MPAVRVLEESALPANDTLVRVHFSSLNYKDGLVLKGRGGLVKKYPHVPGIDLAGVVVHSTHAHLTPDTPVLLTGWRVGELHWGGYAQLASVRADWLSVLPPNLDAYHAMALGTAGLTAALCIEDLESRGVRPGQGTVLVTGAAGGVGSIAVAMLAALGYEVEALTGREGAHEFLRDLGAKRIVARGTLEQLPDKPLLSERWVAAVDTVGGPILARVLSSISYGGSVAACGLAASATLPASVVPFILRGISLLGTDSVQCSSERRARNWARLAGTVPPKILDSITSCLGLDELQEAANCILAGRVRGRIVVDPAR